MSEPQPGLIAPPPAPPRSGLTLAHLSFDFLFALGCTLLCRAATGATLGFLFAPVFLATIFTPPLVLAHRKTVLHIAAWFAISIGVSVGWLAFDGLQCAETFRCIFVLAAYLLAIAALASVLTQLRITETLASAIVTILALLWLTWPVWLSRALLSSHGDAIVAWLSPAHPLLAINEVVRTRFDSWDRYQMAYQQLTVLNQDVLYNLPRNVTASACLHAAIGIVSLVVFRASHFKKKSSHFVQSSRIAP